MGYPKFERLRAGRSGLLALACTALAVMARPVAAEPSETSAAALLDRIQIEDLLIDYYQPLGAAGSDMAQFYIDDGVLDLNGQVFHGKAEIQQIYQRATGAMDPKLKGKVHLLMSNPKIVVDGDTATADLIWTGYASETVTLPPYLVEQGREHDDLVKQAGRWLLKKRAVISDAGLHVIPEKTDPAR